MPTVLLCEHDLAVRELLRIVLRHRGHEVLFPGPDELGASGSADLAVVEPATPDGHAAARRLRRLRPGLPLVFVSTCDPSAETCALAPVAHLVKPFEFDELEAAVRDALASVA